MMTNEYIQLISEIILDPTNTTVFIESGDTMLPIGIDFELDDPTTRVLRIYTMALTDIPIVAKVLPVSNSKIDIFNGISFYEQVELFSEDSQISFSLETEYTGENIENVDLFIYTNYPLVLLREDFVFLNFSRDLYIVDKDNVVIEKLENPKADDEFNSLTIEYLGGTATHTKPYFITNFINGYTKPLFAPSLEACKIEFI